MGGWIRILSFVWTDFWLLGLGVGLFFVSNPIVLNSTSLIINLWFSEDERAQASTIAGLMVPIGCLLGLVLTGMLSTDVDVTSQS